MRHARSNVPIQHIAAYINDASATAKYIVSVGCGNGAYEFEVTRHNNNLRSKLILVDPAPESYEPWPASGDYLKPNYATVDDLLKHKPDVIGNCVLLMIWPDPADNFEYLVFKQLQPLSCIVLNEHVGGDYKSQASQIKINLLLAVIDPVHFSNRSLTLSETDTLVLLSSDKEGGDFLGSAGSIAMNIVLVAPEVFGYRKISQTLYCCNTDFGLQYPRLTWIAKRGSQVPKHKFSQDPIFQLHAIAIADAPITGKKPDSGFKNFCTSLSMIAPNLKDYK
jgi:hypothetical protein